MKTKVARQHVSKRKGSQNQRRNVAALTSAVCVAIVGIYLLSISHAAVSTMNMEAEDGTVSGNAAILQQQQGASGTASVRFGGGASSGCGQAAIQALVNNVSAANLESNLRKLVQDDSKPTPNELISRHISQPGNQIKVDWAKQQYTSYGLQVINQPFTSGGYSLNNVVGRLTGTDQNTLYAIGGHIDAINSQDENVASKPAPGGIDDGSGVVTAMEAARVLKSFQPCLKASIDFIGFNDEEENFGGSTAYVNSLQGKTFKGVYNIDMVSYSPNGVMCDIHRYDNATREKFLADKLATVNTTYGVNLQMSSAVYHEDDTDTSTFWGANLPGLYTNECTPDDNYPGYHSQNDSVSYVNFDALAKTTKLMVAALAELASQ